MGLYGHRDPGDYHRFHYARLSRAGKFPNPDDKDWLRQPLEDKDCAMQNKRTGGAPQALLDRRVLMIALFYYFSLPLGAYGLSYWLPTVVKGFGVTNTVNGFLNIIPWTCVAWAFFFGFYRVLRRFGAHR